MGPALWPRDIAELESKIAPMMTARGLRAKRGTAQAARAGIARAQLALRHKLGMWAFGVRTTGPCRFSACALAASCA